MADPNATETKGMRPIWYFVGWMLLIIGIIVASAGVYTLISPPEQKTKLFELHTGIWWGAVITVAGFIFLWSNRKATVK